jgi:hypothetical protein
MLGALLVALPASRRPMVDRLRSPWFFDSWHRELFGAMNRNWDREGVDLLAAILTPEHTARWPSAAVYLWLLIEDREGNSTCGRVASWTIYADRLEWIAAARAKILALAEQLREVVNECADRFPQP